MLRKLKKLWAWILHGKTTRRLEVEWLNLHYSFDIDWYVPTGAGCLPAAPGHGDRNG